MEMQRRALWLIVGIAGGVLALLGAGGGLLTLALLPAAGDALGAGDTLPVAGLAALPLVLGVPLLLQGRAGWLARPSRPFSLSRGRWMWLAWVLLVALGTAVGALDLAPALLLPPIHVLAMVVLPLGALWLAGQALRGTGGSWREIVASMAGGACLGAGVSLVSEGLIVFALAGVAAAGAWMVPGGPERVTALVQNLQDPAWVADVDNLLRLLLSPVVALSLLGLLCVPVPLIEEALKTLAAGVVARWIRPRPARAFLWGVAGGAGFALTENLLNGVLGGAEGWAMSAVARLGATTMHCLTGGLLGWGWGQLWTARRPLRLLGVYGLAVVVHALWNAATVGAMLLGASALVHGEEPVGLACAGLGTLALLGLLGALTLAFVAALAWGGRWLVAQAEPRGE